MATAALNLGYQQKEQAGARPQVRVVQGGRRRLDKVRQTLAAVRGVLTAALVLGLIVSLVYSQSMVTALNGEVSAARKELTTAKSDYDYLSASMDGITSRANIEEIAEGRLGLVKADASQITYVRLENEGIIEKKDDKVSQVMQGFRTAALSLLSNLNP
ncbi:MAG: hypothetical protein PHO10_12230 [Gemmiger sp.]|nr:hypothetical protein [Gemmiger sp.]